MTGTANAAHTASSSTGIPVYARQGACARFRPRRLTVRNIAIVSALLLCAIAISTHAQDATPKNP